MTRTPVRVLPFLMLGLTLACSTDRADDAPTGEPADPAAATAPATEEMLPELQAAVQSNPNDPALRRRLAIALHEAGKKQDSVEHFEKSAELNPGVRTFLDLGLAYGSVSRLPEAEATYQRILATSPEHPVALHNLGNLAMKLEQAERAIDLYRRALAAKPDYLLAQFHIGDALKKAERYREAFAAYEKVLDMEPQSARDVTTYDNALYGMASLHIQMGAFQQAGPMLVELLRANPKHPKAHYALGQVLVQLGKPDEAQKSFEKHMQLRAGSEPESGMAMGD